MHWLIGKRIELPVHFDLWMRGAKYGRVLAVKQGFNNTGDYLLVELDNPRLGYVHITREHWPYIRPQEQEIA